MNTNSVSPRWVLSLWVIPAKGTRLLSMRISTTCKLNSHVSSTIYLGDMVQRDKNNIFDNINEM